MLIAGLSRVSNSTECLNVACTVLLDSLQAAMLRVSSSCHLRGPQRASLVAGPILLSRAFAPECAKYYTAVRALPTRRLPAYGAVHVSDTMRRA